MLLGQRERCRLGTSNQTLGGPDKADREPPFTSSVNHEGLLNTLAIVENIQRQGFIMMT